MKHQEKFKFQSIGDQYYLISSNIEYDFPLVASFFLKNIEFSFQYLSASKDELCISKELSQEELVDLLLSYEAKQVKAEIHIVDVCFEKGEDWAEVESITGLVKDRYIKKLLATNLQVAMTGFYPGFIYLEGLIDQLLVPRKTVPRLSVQKGSFAVGGQYAGIYNIQSPGGWSIIGQCKTTLWNVDQNPPIPWSIGDCIQIKRITLTEFENENRLTS